MFHILIASSCMVACSKIPPTPPLILFPTPAPRSGSAHKRTSKTTSTASVVSFLQTCDTSLARFGSFSH